ncbi:MAG: AraC family transcriptional regulator [Bacteroidota bacterium]
MVYFDIIYLFQGFPEFNLYSTPLLILVVQGLILSGLLLSRYVGKKALPDLLLALILLIMCYHRTTYTLGFMGWYDTFRNTKINYYLVNMGMLMAPLIYFYVKSVLQPNFRLQRKHLWHFLPWILFFVTKMVILGYDASQPGFADNQNGYLVINFQWKFLDPIVTFVSSAQMLLYLAFSFQLYYRYKYEIQQFFSNLTKKELSWIFSVLLAYSFLFVYGLLQVFVDDLVVELSWTQKWWIEFLSAVTLLYLGVKGYFTDFGFLKDFESDTRTSHTGIKGAPAADTSELNNKKRTLEKLFSEEQLFLDPELNLAQLSERLNMNRAEVSEIINSGFGKNFNDFVNAYRIEQFKQRLQKGDNKQLSLVGLAFDCGFNSKATFNRVFKKEVKLTPTEYLKSLSA